MLGDCFFLADLTIPPAKPSIFREVSRALAFAFADRFPPPAALFFDALKAAFFFLLVALLFFFFATWLLRELYYFYLSVNQFGGIMRVKLNAFYKQPANIGFESCLSRGQDAF
jgi:hypothetical protein